MHAARVFVATYTWPDACKHWTSRIGIEPTQNNLEGWSPSIRRPRHKPGKSARIPVLYATDV
jgi:hypothetical protein